MRGCYRSDRGPVEFELGQLEPLELAPVLDDDVCRVNFAQNGSFDLVTNPQYLFSATAIDDGIRGSAVVGRQHAEQSQVQRGDRCLFRRFSLGDFRRRAGITKQAGTGCALNGGRAVAASR